jgi:hypothetical protein
MRRLATGLMVLMASCAVVTAAHAEEADRVSEPIDVPGDRGSAVEYELGETVTATGRIYADDFFGDTIVKANPTVMNNADHPVQAIVHIAFLDDSGNLIGCATQNSDLEAGEETQFGSCLVFVPEDEIDKITTFKAALYTKQIEGDQ